MLLASGFASVLFFAAFICISSQPQDGPTPSQIMQLIPEWIEKDGCQ
jgi:hypothetical protein